MKDQYDQIAEVDTIVEKSEDVEKFNPWHDARGRFTTAGGGGGRGSFSANPKTKAGQLAIQRAYNSGKHTTFNRHKESKGENVYQNYKWLNSRGGSFPGSRKPKGFTGTTSRNGLNARTNTRTYSKPPKNYLQGTGSSSNTSASKPKQQTTSKPAASKPKTTSKPAASSQKPAASTNHKMANGKDITKSFTPKGTTKQEIMDEVARKQGFKGQGRVVTDKAEFENAVKKGGVVMYRTLGPGTDVISGQYKLPSDFAKMMKTGSEDELSLNGSGASYYGQGIYTASTKITPGKKPSARDQIEAADGSVGYAWAGAGKTVAMTLDPSAKVGKYDDLYQELLNAPASEIRKFGTDVGAYAAAKGYDALTEDVGGGVYYTMVYNRTKVIFYDAEYDNYKSSRGHKNSPESF